MCRSTSPHTFVPVTSFLSIIPNVSNSPSSPLAHTTEAPSNDSFPYDTSSFGPTPPNIHPMLTRSKTGSLKSRLFLAHVEPANIKQALSSPQWLLAMKAEYQALRDNNTWSLVPLPPHRKPIGCK